MLRSIAHISCYTNAQYDIQNWTGYMRNRYFSLEAILAHCGGVAPQICNSLFAENFVRKGGGGVPPISVTYFLDQKQVFFGQKTPFLALFEDNFSGECP